MILDHYNMLLVLASGLARVGVGSVFCYMAYLTWHNPHPIGKFVTPRLFGVLGLYCWNDGMRAVFFYLGIAQGVTISLILTLGLCVLLLWSVSKVERKLMTGRRKDAR